MSVLTPGRNLVLIGLMGSGKTTVGRAVARLLGRPFVDTDEVIEAEEGRTIAEIFATRGERAFRAIEAGAVRRVSALRGQVIAVGGGAILDPSSVTSLRGTGDLVWLDAPTSAMAMHLSADAERGSRPLLGPAGQESAGQGSAGQGSGGQGSGGQGSAVQDSAGQVAGDLIATLDRLRRDRHDAYARAATHVIDTQGRPPEVLADEVLAWARAKPGLLAREERP